jgi:hypothetical protein
MVINESRSHVSNIDCNKLRASFAFIAMFLYSSLVGCYLYFLFLRHSIHCPLIFLRSAKQTRGSKQSKNAARSVAKVGTASQASLEASCKHTSVVDQPKKGFVKITHVVSNQHCCRRPCESMHIKIIWRILYSKLI